MRTIQDIKLIPIRDYLVKRGIAPGQENSRYGFYLSPLREEQDASFKVDYTQNLWYDFGAGRGGSIIDLVMEIEKCNFQQAVERLRNDGIDHIVESFRMQASLNPIAKPVAHISLDFSVQDKE